MTRGSIPVRKRFPYRRPAEIDAARPRRVSILIVGGGPIGLTAAIDLAHRGHQVVVLNRLDILAGGSKAICFNKRTLDIYDRLGLADRIIAKSVVWNVGKVFWGTRSEPIYQFDLEDAPHQKNPAFVNLQQYSLEEFLIEAAEAEPNIDLRWRHEAVAVAQAGDRVAVTVETPDGRYMLDADYVLACDGARSSIRAMLGLDFEGRVFEDNFLIADVRFDQQRPSERWFWFEPPFPGHSALLHKQPDGVWRLDFQLGWNIDKAEAVKPENVAPFVEGMLGKGVDYQFEWISVYTFHCRRMQRFVHDRVIFAGDAAHVVSPFGARGANSGIADVENLVWKLDLVLNGLANAALLETYDEEATAAADVNLLNSTRATDFITPKSAASRALRDAVLGLSTHCPFARPFVNSGRLATAVAFPSSSLNTPDPECWEGGVEPGSPALDAPVESANGSWLLQQLSGRFTLLAFANGLEGELGSLVESLAAEAPLRLVTVGDGGHIRDAHGLLADRYNARPGTLYLIRPDQYVAARWRGLDPFAIAAALRRACAHPIPTSNAHAARA